MTDELAQNYIERGIRNPQLIEAALAINDDRLHEAEPILRAHLKRNPLDVAAIRLMAQLAARVGRAPKIGNPGKALRNTRLNNHWYCGTYNDIPSIPDKYSQNRPLFTPSPRVPAAHQDAPYPILARFR